MSFDTVVFGRRLRSEMEIAELPPRAGRGGPDWILEKSRIPLDPEGMELQGEEDVTSTVRVRLWRHDSGSYLLDFDDTGRFLVAPGRLTWWPGSDPDPGKVGQDLVGRVLPLAAHLEGRVALHASAVAFGHGAVAFLAPKGCGKSTLALACTAEAGRLLSDDVVVVETGAPPTTVPGVRTARLTSEASAALKLDAHAGPVQADGKRRLAPPGSAPEPFRRLPLQALYLVAPTPDPEGQRVVERVELEPFRATAALLGQTKLGGLLGPAQEPGLLEAVASVARAVPVLVLHVPRRLDALTATARTLAGWHVEGGPSGAVLERA